MTDKPEALPAVRLTRGERNLNALRALLRLIPAVGDSIDQLAFGPLDELRGKRVESTLHEIVRRLNERGAEPGRTEEFANLTEKALPHVARATNEDVRQRFRDLLTNAAPLPGDDSRWSDANLAEQLLTELDGPALGLLAQLARYNGPLPAAVVSKPTPQIVSEQNLDWNNPPQGSNVVGYTWPVVEEWTRRLREKRLIWFSSHNSSAGGFGGIALTELGKVLVQWTVDTRAA